MSPTNSVRFSFLAAWVIGYGIIQSVAPAITGKKQGRTAFLWALLLAAIPAIIAICLQAQFNPYLTLLGGLLIFGALFAVNSSLHNYLIVSYAT